MNRIWFVTRKLFMFMCMQPHMRRRILNNKHRELPPGSRGYGGRKLPPCSNMQKLRINLAFYVVGAGFPAPTTVNNYNSVYPVGIDKPVIAPDAGGRTFANSRNAIRYISVAVIGEPVAESIGLNWRRPSFSYQLIGWDSTRIQSSRAIRSTRSRAA